MRHAITREVSPRLGDCELSFVDRHRIDVGLAQDQHRAYLAALRSLPCEVTVLPAEPEFPDSVFVEDTAVVLDELALLTRPGAVSRRGEVDSIASALASHRPLQRIEAPGMLDGGDVLRLGRTLFVGQGERSNDAALQQMRALLAPHGYRVEGVTTRECLHLKSAVTQVAEDVIVVQPRWIDVEVFSGWRHIEVDPGEEHAANALRIGATVLMPASFPRTRERLSAAGIETIAIDVSELQKAEGAVTCCSLVFEA